MTQDEIIEANCRQNFAAARGARIQIFVSETRIHPDDAHLQYGPISTALRKMAKNPNEYGTTSWDCYLAEGAINEFIGMPGRYYGNYPLFYLFLAEFLADEGM